MTFLRGLAKKKFIRSQLSTEAWTFYNTGGPPGVSSSTTARRIARRTGKSVLDCKLTANVDGSQCGDYVSHRLLQVLRKRNALLMMHSLRWQLIGALIDEDDRLDRHRLQATRETGAWGQEVDCL